MYCSFSSPSPSSIAFSSCSKSYSGSSSGLLVQPAREPLSWYINLMNSSAVLNNLQFPPQTQLGATGSGHRSGPQLLATGLCGAGAPHRGPPRAPGARSPPRLLRLLGSAIPSSIAGLNNLRFAAQTQLGNTRSKTDGTWPMRRAASLGGDALRVQRRNTAALSPHPPFSHSILHLTTLISSSSSSS